MPIHPSSLYEVREAMVRLKGQKAVDVCNISAELLKVGGEATTREIVGCMSSSEPFNSLVPFLLTSKGDWLSLFIIIIII